MPELSHVPDDTYRRRPTPPGRAGAASGPPHSHNDPGKQQIIIDSIEFFLAG